MLVLSCFYSVGAFLGGELFYRLGTPAKVWMLVCLEKKLKNEFCTKTRHLQLRASDTSVCAEMSRWGGDTENNTRNHKTRHQTRDRRGGFAGMYGRAENSTSKIYEIESPCHFDVAIWCEPFRALSRTPAEHFRALSRPFESWRTTRR